MSKAKSTTRSKTCDPVFGHGQELVETALPTYEDVMKFYLLVQKKTENERTGQHPSISEIAEVVAQHLEKLWQKASIPIVTHTRVLQKIRQYQEKYKQIIKHYKSRQNRDSFKLQLKAFQDESKQLFDVAACKCDFSMCQCEKLNCVPIQERPFLADQRSLRLICIGSVDILETHKLKRKLERKSKRGYEIATTGNASEVLAQYTINDQSSSECEKSDSDDDYPKQKKSCEDPSTSCASKKAISQNRLNLPFLAKVSDRYGVSDRAAAALASSVLEDVGIVQPQDTSMVADRSKLRRQ